MLVPATTSPLATSSCWGRMAKLAQELLIKWDCRSLQPKKSVNQCALTKSHRCKTASGTSRTTLLSTHFSWCGRHPCGLATRI